MSAMVRCDVVGCDVTAPTRGSQPPENWRVLLGAVEATETPEATRFLTSMSGMETHGLAIGPARKFMRPTTAHICPDHEMPKLRDYIGEDDGYCLAGVLR